jgi:hypothetical protein
MIRHNVALSARVNSKSARSAAISGMQLIVSSATARAVQFVVACF